MEKIVGFNIFRLQQDDSFFEDEVLFNSLFNEYMAYSHNRNFWDYLFGASDRQEPLDTLSERELKIVASVIQWLGTPVGTQFLHKAGFDKKDIEIKNRYIPDYNTMTFYEESAYVMYKGKLSVAYGINNKPVPFPKG